MIPNKDGGRTFQPVTRTAVYRLREGNLVLPNPIVRQLRNLFRRRGDSLSQGEQTYHKRTLVQAAQTSVPSALLHRGEVVVSPSLAKHLQDSVSRAYRHKL